MEIKGRLKARIDRISQGENYNITTKMEAHEPLPHFKAYLLNIVDFWFSTLYRIWDNGELVIGKFNTNGILLTLNG